MVGSDSEGLIAVSLASRQIPVALWRTGPLCLLLLLLGRSDKALHVAEVVAQHLEVSIYLGLCASPPMELVLVRRRGAADADVAVAAAAAAAAVS